MRKKKEMYNEDQKEKYLESLRCEHKYKSTTIENIIAYFHGSSGLEEFYGKDLSEFTHQEISEMIKKMNSSSRRYLGNICVYFADYYNWCLNKCIVTDTENKYEGSYVKKLIEDLISVESLYEKYFDRNTMLEYINNIYAPENKYIAYALYLGIKGEEFIELINVKFSDLNQDTKELTLITDRKVIVDDIFVKLMIDADNSKEYNKDGTNKDSKQDYYSYKPNGYILKQTARGKVETVTPDVIRDRLNVIKNQSGNAFFTSPTIYKNGLIHHIIKRHHEDSNDINLKKILFHEINKKLYTHDGKTTEYIEDFGSKIEVKMLRNEISDYVGRFETDDEEYTYEEYASEIERLRKLEDLDKTLQVKSRIEQSYLRKQLFGNEKFVSCGICGEILPIELLVTAHIKKRSECSKEERLDVDNIVMPMCKMGCDDLYEKGYILVENGSIIKNRKPIINDMLTPIIDEYLNKLENKKCSKFNPNNKGYFEYHNNNFK